MPVRAEIHEGVVPVKVYTRDRATARQQLVNISRLPTCTTTSPRCPMCTSHRPTVGSVIPTKQANHPGGVGVDIGCRHDRAGAFSLPRTSLDEPSLRKVFNQISRDVPVGSTATRTVMRAPEAARDSRRITKSWSAIPASQAREQAHELGAAS